MIVAMAIVKAITQATTRSIVKRFTLEPTIIRQRYPQLELSTKSYARHCQSQLLTHPKSLVHF